MADNPYDRPLIVTILGILYALAALVLLIAAVAMMVGGESLMTEIIEQNPDLEGLEGAAMIFGVMLLVAAIIEGVISYGFLKGWSIMWYLALIFTIIGAVMNIITVAMGGFLSIISLLVEVVIILYLFKPNVKQFFLKSA